MVFHIVGNPKCHNPLFAKYSGSINHRFHKFLHKFPISNRNDNKRDCVWFKR